MHVLILPSYYPSRERPATGMFIHEQGVALKKAGYQVGVLDRPPVGGHTPVSEARGFQKRGAHVPRRRLSAIPGVSDALGLVSTPVSAAGRPADHAGGVIVLSTNTAPKTGDQT